VKIYLVIPVLLMTSACSMPPHIQLSSSPSPMRASAVGCWQLDSSPGLLGRLLEPSLVRLDTAALGDGAMRMHVISPVREHGVDMNHWGMTAVGDHVVLRFSNGFGGVVVQAAIRGDELRGRGRTWVDIPAPPRRGRVRGVRVPCPSGSAVG
jgi:hypothetical protein